VWASVCQPANAAVARDVRRPQTRCATPTSRKAPINHRIGIPAESAGLVIAPTDVGIGKPTQGFEPRTLHYELRA